MRFAIVFALLFTLGVAAPQPALSAHVPAAVLAHSAKLIGAPAAAQRLQLSFSLPLRNEDALRARLAAMYDPSSPAFRRYLSVAQFTQSYGPSAADYQTLVNFAVANNLHPHAPAANRQVLDVDGTVGDVERALHVQIGLYQHPTEARVFYAPDREPTPALGIPLLHISGLDNFVLPYSHVVRSNSALPSGLPPTGSGPRNNFIGSDVRAAYYGGTALIGTGQSIGLFEYAGYRLGDIAHYFRAVGQHSTVPIVGVSLNGAELDCPSAAAPQCDDAEQALDMEEALSMAPGLKQLVVYVGHNDVSIINQMASDNTSKQLSCSWGWQPDAKVLDPIFLEMAAQGQSFFVATGDYGYHLKEGAVWPADDQLVTAVGGTDLSTKGPGGPWRAETGWLYSGGGPSPDGVKIPAYQSPFINERNEGSTTLRNVPDIAADANEDNFSCYDFACYTGNGGTSYAAPILSGYLALANELAAALDKPPVGFLNPTIYRLGARANYLTLFHDQTVGQNGRYFATRGFDLVTGFGSPNGDALLKALATGR